MDSQNQERRVKELSRLLAEAGLSLRKGLGQNFLTNEGVLAKIARAVDCGPEDLVLEIGCGLGNLTELLAREARLVVAVELDERFRPIHQRLLGESPRVRFHYGDFMRVNLPELLREDRTPGRLLAVGNIPYNITSPILFKLMGSSLDFSKIVLLMQREVAQRLVAAPGTNGYGILAVKVGVRYRAEILFTVSPGSFLPPPSVHSALVQLTPLPSGPIFENRQTEVAFFRFVDAMFAQRRKQLPRGLSNGSGGILERESVRTALRELGLSETARAETLDVAECIALFDALGQPELPVLRTEYSD